MQETHPSPIRGRNLSHGIPPDSRSAASEIGHHLPTAHSCAHPHDKGRAEIPRDVYTLWLLRLLPPEELDG